LLLYELCIVLYCYKNFSPHRRVQNGSGAHPASFPVGIGTLSLWVKLTTHLYLVPRSNNTRSYTSTLPVRLHGVVLN